MLKNTCPRIDSVASHSSVPPYWALTAGPNSHSPAPIATPAIRIPGPINVGSFFQSIDGGSGSSPTSHGWSAPPGRFSGVVDSGAADRWSSCSVMASFPFYNCRFSLAVPTRRPSISISSPAPSGTNPFASN